MRFRIRFSSSRPQLIPVNYQYPLSAWIYKVFSQVDQEFSEWLHELGYQFEGTKKFKLFTFSRFNIPDVQFIKKTGSLLVPGDMTFDLSLLMEEAASKFIQGLFKGQELAIGDPGHHAVFHTKTIEKVPEPEFTKNEVFQTLSPVVVSISEERNGRLISQYISPDHPQYGARLIENLVRKQTAIKKSRMIRVKTIEEMQGELVYNLGSTELNDDWIRSSRLDKNSEEFKKKDKTPTFYLKKDFNENLSSSRTEDKGYLPAFDFELLNTPKSRLITIKKGTFSETKVRGWEFRFRLNTDEELLRIGYEAGFGEKGSGGFGMVRFVNVK